MSDVDSPSEATTGSKRLIVRILKGIGILLLAILAYLVAWPSPINPVAFQPPAAPLMTGVLETNKKLRDAEILAAGKIRGPEDVDVDDQGRVYGGLEDGRVIRVLPDGTIETFADTGGRPLGMEFDAEGNLIVADGIKGLVSIDPQGNVTVLTDSAANVPFGFTDDLDIASDGRIYFSDASSKYGVGEFLYDMLEARPHGRMMRYDPATGETEVLLEGLYFANGIAVADDDRFVLVNETYRYRIRRYWLSGEKAGSNDIFIDNLPGFPDGVSRGSVGRFWVAMFTVRNSTADSLHPRRWLKSVLAKLPNFMWPRPEPIGFVLALDEDGNIVESLQDPGGEVINEVTSIHEDSGVLYLGTLRGDRIGKYTLP